MLNALFVNFCILCTTTLLVNWTLRSLAQAWTPLHLGLRGVLTVLSAFALVLNAVPLSGGATLDLRAVPVALAALGGGWPAGLTVALPLAVHGVWQGGPRGLAVALTLALVVALTAVFRPRTATMLDNPGVSPWQPFAIFSLSNLPLVLGAWWSGQGAAVLGYAALITAVQAVGMLASQAITLTQLRALEEGKAMQTLAYSDPLTALGNRRAFDEALSGALPDTHLLLMDLDHFKRVNDLHGHGVGDNVLVATAGVLHAVLGERAQVFRHGGEEFAALLKVHSAPEARAAAEAARTEVAALVAGQCGLSAHPVTLSVGVARVGGDAAAARLAADHALYAAKRAGRNRVVQAGQAPQA